MIVRTLLRQRGKLVVMQPADMDLDVDEQELLELIAVAHWHYSGGYDRSDGTHVGKHSYIVKSEEEWLFRLLTRRLLRPDHWFGRYQGRGFVYTYVTLGDGLTYWGLKGPIINRDAVDRASRECAAPKGIEERYRSYREYPG
jgi:hypothetical protein